MTNTNTTCHQPSAASLRGWWRPLFVVALVLVSGLSGPWFGMQATVTDAPSGQPDRPPYRDRKVLATDASNLKATQVTPHLETTIHAGTNLLWCGTMQLAWNEVCALVGDDVQLRPDHPMVAALNQRRFTKDHLDVASYVAMAGFVATNTHEKIQKAVKAKFGSTFSPPPKPSNARPQDITAYACLFKKLDFARPFERLDEALRFNGVEVRAFGLQSYKSAHHDLYPQVLIHDYQNENDFVIELKTKSAGDRLILAKVQPGADLAATVAQVQARVGSTEASTAIRGDVLVIPRLNFDLTRRYSELEGRQLITANRSVASDLRLLSAVQNTRFEMNERGVELRSEAHLGIGCSATRIPTPEHRMIFDRPFLILLQRTDAPLPYFALWVDNAELLVRK
jgi:hypothetical protein